MGMFWVISGCIFCGISFGYALLVLHKGTAERPEQHAGESVARVNARVVAIGRQGQGRGLRRVAWAPLLFDQTKISHRCR
jgi:hypothetical protein